MASIEKRGDYTYRITVSNGYDRNDKKIVERKTITLDASLTARQAKKELERIVVEFETKVKKGDIIDSSITFEKFTEKWLVEHAEKRLERVTIDSYKIHLETKILPAIGHIKLADLKPRHLIKFYDSLTQDGVRIDGKKGGYSTRIIKYQHQIISSILQTAVLWQTIDENIAKRVRPPRGVESKKSNNYFDEKQIRNFLEYVTDNEPIENVAMAYVTAYGGLRKGELLGLEWGDIDFSNNVITINKVLARVTREEYIKSPKNASSVRTVALPASVMRLLKEMKLKSAAERVFPYSYYTPTKWFKRVVADYNNTHEDKLPEHITFHGLRHTSATLLIASGMDIKTISSRLGHNDTTTTLNIYAHALKSKDKAASDMLEELLDINVKE